MRSQGGLKTKISIRQFFFVIQDVKMFGIKKNKNGNFDYWCGFWIFFEFRRGLCIKNVMEFFR